MPELNSNQILVRDPRWSAAKDLSPAAKGIFTGLEELVELPGVVGGFFNDNLKYDVDLTPQAVEDYSKKNRQLAQQILSEHYGPEKGVAEANRLFDNTEFAASFIDPTIAVGLGAKGIAKGAKVIDNAGGTGKYIDAWIEDATRGFQEVPLDQAKSVGAKVASEKTIYIKDLDGNVKPVSGTPAMLKEKYGVNPKALSDKNRQTGRVKDGTQWSKSEEGFKDFATGKTIKDIEVEKLDPTNLGFSDTPARFPAALGKDFRKELGFEIDDILTDVEADFFKDVHLDDIIGLENKNSAEKISNMAWPKITELLKRYDNQLTPEQHNKVAQWARNRSRQIFDVMETADAGPVKIDPVSGIGEVNEFIKVPGANTRRLDHLEGYDRAAAKDSALSLTKLKREHGNDEAMKIYHNLKAGREMGILDDNYKLIDDGTSSGPAKPKLKLGIRSGDTPKRANTVQVDPIRRKRNGIR